MGKNLYKKILQLVRKLGAFGLKIGTFLRLLVVASYPCRVWPSDWHVASEA